MNGFQVFVVVPRRWKSRQEEGRIAEQQEELEEEKRRRRRVGEDEVDDENNKKEKKEEEEDNHEPASLGPRSLNGGTRFCYSFLTTTTFTLQRHKLFNILMVVLF